MRMNKVENVLYQLGIYPSQAGYPIAQTAIALAIKEPSRLQRLTLDFYPEVGKQCGCYPCLCRAEPQNFRCAGLGCQSKATYSHGATGDRPAAYRR